MSASTLSGARVSRRTLVASGLASASLVPVGTSLLAVAHPASSTLPTSVASQEVAASPLGWRMWLLDAPDALRPEAPAAPTEAEVEEVVAAQAASSDEQAAAIATWGGGGYVTFPWIDTAFALLDEFGLGGMPMARFLGILSTALHDAEIAAWDAQVAHARPGPAATDERITAADGVDPAASSFPSAHAAVAGAAAVVLAYLLPDAEAGRFDTLATEAAESRIAAGAAFRSDIDAGLALGQAVGELAMTRAKADGADAVWDPTTMPSGPGIWQPTPPGFVETPAAPLAGSRVPWVLESNDQFMPAPPPEYGSAAWRMELEAVQDIAKHLTFDQRRLALWWGDNSPWGLSTGWAQDLIRRGAVDSPHAAQILADIHVAMADAITTVWRAKYTWWTSRPITEDPDLQTVLITPPYPAYPSGYSGAIGAGTTVIGYYFPETTDDMAARAWEAAASRCWGGIHYPIDDDTGLFIGRQVGRLVSSIARGGDA